MLKAKLAVVWSTLYFVSFVVLLAITDLSHPFMVVIAFVLAVLNSVFLTWLIKPMLDGDRRERSTAQDRLRRFLLSAIGFVIIAFLVGLWIGLEIWIARIFNLSEWLFVGCVQALTGLAFLIWMTSIAPDNNTITFSAEELMQKRVDWFAYREWERNITIAVTNSDYKRVVELLRTHDADTVAKLFYLLKKEKPEIAHLVTHYIENAPLTHSLVAPFRNCIISLNETDESAWKQLVSKYRINEKLPDVSLRRSGYIVKRTIDIAISSFLFFGPFLPLAWLSALLLAIQYRSIQRVFFVSYRVGFLGNLFKRCQFRTLTRVTENDISTTRIGNILIWTQIDKLPSLWNVMIGDMSLIGPSSMYQPTAIDLVEEGTPAIDRLRVLLTMRPGIVDAAYLDAFLSASNDYQAPDGFFDIRYNYVKGWSLMKDILLVRKAILLYLSFLLSNGVSNSALPPMADVTVLPPAFLRDMDSPFQSEAGD